MQIFDNLYCALVLGRKILGSSTVDETATMLWDTLQSHDGMSDFVKHEIQFHHSINYIFVWFLIMAKMSELIQEIT